LRRESPWSPPVEALSRPLQRSRSSSTSQCPVLTHLSPSQNFALARRWICSSPLTNVHDGCETFSARHVPSPLHIASGWTGAHCPHPRFPSLACNSHLSALELHICGPWIQNSAENKRLIGLFRNFLIHAYGNRRRNRFALALSLQAL
jgi:hypothetical protein